MSGNYFLKGLGIGAAVGVAVSLILVPKPRRSKTKVGQAVRSFGNIVDTIANTFMM